MESSCGKTPSCPDAPCTAKLDRPRRGERRPPVRRRSFRALSLETGPDRLAEVRVAVALRRRIAERLALAVGRGQLGGGEVPVGEALEPALQERLPVVLVVQVVGVLP